MKRKKLAAFGLVIALTASSSSAAFAAAVPAASNMETTADGSGGRDRYRYSE